ncbi:MAG: SufD family Fe-S cluster assembly protein [bacterium]
MTRIVKKYSEPGKWEVLIPFEKVREEIEWTGVIDARDPGDYELRVVVEHNVKQTKGRIMIKAVVGKGARVKIKGLVKIGKSAQETDEYLELRVLMLDKTAVATVEPELEIEANNVKAGHGASVGRVDREQLLYLMSRGLSKDTAEEQIVNGWLGV